MTNPHRSFDIADAPPPVREHESRAERRARLARETTVRWGRDRISRGLCLQCGHPYADQHHVRCDSCREKVRIAVRARRARLTR